VSLFIGLLPDSNRMDYDYDYEKFDSDPITIKDDEALRKASESGAVTEYRPKSPRVAYNLHLDNPRSGGRLFNNNNQNDIFVYEELGDAHPKYCYYAEPIPRQKLGEYIRLFYWQTKQLSEGEIVYNDVKLREFADWVNKNFYMSNKINYEKGIKLADRYEEVFK